MLRGDGECLENVVVVGRIKPKTPKLLDDRAHVINKLVATFRGLEENSDSIIGCCAVHLLQIFMVEHETSRRRKAPRKRHFRICRASFGECAAETSSEEFFRFHVLELEFDLDRLGNHGEFIADHNDERLHENSVD